MFEGLTSFLNIFEILKKMFGSVNRIRASKSGKFVKENKCMTPVLGITTLAKKLLRISNCFSENDEFERSTDSFYT